MKNIHNKYFKLIKSSSDFIFIVLKSTSNYYPLGYIPIDLYIHPESFGAKRAEESKIIRKYVKTKSECFVCASCIGEVIIKPSIQTVNTIPEFESNITKLNNEYEEIQKLLNEYRNKITSEYVNKFNNGN